MLITSARIAPAAAMAIGVLIFASGCNSSPSNDYRRIQDLASSAPSDDGVPHEGLTANSEPADAMQVDNDAMMSIRPEMPLRIIEEPVSALAISNPRQIELLVPAKAFAKDRRTGALRLAFDDMNLLTVLNMDPVTPDAVSWMPEWMTALEGQLVRVRGFMLPTYQAEDLEQFVLLRDNQECCYGDGAKIYDHMLITMKAGTTTTYVPLTQIMDVFGRFKINLQSANGKVYELYSIEDATVVPR